MNDSYYFKPISKPKKKVYKFSLPDLKYLNIGFYISLPLFLGLTIGILLDNLFHTRPKLVLVSLFLGVLATFFNIYKLIAENQKK